MVMPNGGRYQGAVDDRPISRDAASADATPGPKGLRRMARPLARQRRLTTVMAGLALLITCAVGVIGLVAAVNAKVAVLAVARDVPYGTTLTEQDIATAKISDDPALSPISADDIDSIVGKVARTELAAGSLLTRDQLVDELKPAAGTQAVSLPLRADQYPAQGLRPRDSVLVVTTPQADGDPSAVEPDQIPATVVAVGSASETGDRVVDVLVGSDSGPKLAAWAATGRIGLVLEPRR